MGKRFEHRFEGPGVLDGLLELAGSGLDSQEVLGRFVAGHQAGEPSSAIIPTLFEGEPRFADPELARRLYQNLLGLWDLVTSGKKIELNPTQGPRREKRPKPTPPPPFDPAQGPDAAFVEAAWQYLEDLPEGDARELGRLTHAFDNRQDALVQWLEEAGLEDDAYLTARYLLFELFVMLEVGGGTPLRGVTRKELQEAPEDGSEVPEALRAYAEEAVFESELADAQAFKPVVKKGLWALWRARKG